MIDLALHRLPTPLKLVLTVFLAMLGAGYLFAIANIYASHSGADGKPGLSFDDLKAVYSGITVDRSTARAVPPHMLKMIEGAMRQYLADDADYAVLHAWLAEGDGEAGLDLERNGLTPRRVITLNCLRCHAADSGERIATKAPFGPDQLTVDYEMISKFTTAGTTQAAGTVRIGPESVPHLILITHAHMLAIPIFTLIVAFLFWLTPLPAGVRSPLVPVPMLALVVDFSSWWLARISPAFCYAIAAAGGIYGAVFGFQLLAVAYAMWRPQSARPSTAVE